MKNKIILTALIGIILLSGCTTRNQTLYKSETIYTWNDSGGVDIEHIVHVCEGECSFEILENTTTTTTIENCTKSILNGEEICLEWLQAITIERKPEIHIDCKFVKEHQNDTTLDFLEGTEELCKQVFPELWSD